ncbi:hypothetical protein N656DRAFT_490669 [Canariomyces notabilis]|uniref:Extracellular membrane protein CFEM domain-containing protein n=1 Tax=Canariomyces notabilis TaxID=2074819 RepID=A0AAN6YV67_9PEZI|nr:hypothetical protein N656DRAFT_490669 [Canariomyces arenarius]
MGQHGRQPFSREVALLLLMASTASALSLSNFQVIGSSAVPISCILAYNNEIPGCTVNDFVRGRTCSAECVRGLEEVQETIESVCSNVNAPATSVLGQVLAGNLVNLLCPGASGDAPMPTIRPPTTSAVETPTSTEESVTQTTSDFEQFPTSAQSSTSVSTSTTSGLSAEPTQDTDESGGGSPFDAFSSNSGSPRLTIRWAEAAPVGLIVGLIVMR